jgi:two-component system sensor histidine kinase HydH
MTNVPGVLRRGIIQPKYILAIVIVLIGMMVGMTLYELSASRQDITRILQEEAMSLAEAISIMSDNSLVCFSKIEDLVFERLLSNARILEWMDHRGRLSDEVLRDIAERNEVYRIDVFSKNGRRVLSSHAQGSSDLPVIPQADRLAAHFAPLLNGAEDEMVTGLDEYRSGLYAVGVRRRKGGAIVLNMDAEQMLNFRRDMGIGSLIQTIGDNEGIKYIVLQDEDGLILASRNVTEMRRIAGDDFLESALQNRWLDTRIYPFGGEEVLEVVSPFQIDDTSYGLFRIGLSMEEVQAVKSRGKQRLILIAFAAFVIGIVSLSLLLVSQNYSLLSKAYDKMRTYTGMVLENIADGIIVSDSKGVISVFNRAAERILKKSAREAIGTSVAELAPEMRKALQDAFSGQAPDRDSEIAVRLPEAGSRMLSVRTSRIAETEAGQDSIVAIVRDVTEAKLMEDNMRRTEQLTAMGKLASAVAHEVRNPLNAISMITQRLGREFVPREREEKYRELVSMVRSESARLNGIVEEFLQFARPPKLNRQQVGMNQLLDEAISLIEAQATDRDIEISKEYSELGDWILDREQMKQALLNLLLNGIEAMPDGGVLSIKDCPGAGALCLEISDTGKGIPEEDVPRIFDLYFTTKETGTGLGLSIVQRIVTEHGGWVDVDSVPGSGTTFRIHFPEEARADE